LETLPGARGMLVARRFLRGEAMPDKSNRIIVTVIGVDTVGIIAAVSTVLADAASTSWTSRRRHSASSSR
jgi:hypothetical protein